MTAPTVSVRRPTARWSSLRLPRAPSEPMKTGSVATSTISRAVAPRRIASATK